MWSVLCWVRVLFREFVLSTVNCLEEISERFKIGRDYLGFGFYFVFIYKYIRVNFFFGVEFIVNVESCGVLVFFAF